MSVIEKETAKNINIDAKLISSDLFWRIFFNTKATAALNNSEELNLIVFKNKKSKEVISLLEIYDITETSSYFNRKIILKLNNLDYYFYVTKKSEISACVLKQKLALKLKQYLLEHIEFVEELHSNTTTFIERDRYISHYDKTQFLDYVESKQADPLYFQLEKIYENSFLAEMLRPEHKYQIFEAYDVIKNLETKISDKNTELIKNDLIKFKNDFDTFETNPLTLEQREAAIYFESVNLLVASAGSGKTSAVTGKVMYSLKKKIFKPNEVLILAFNKSAARELSDRFTKLVKTSDVAMNPENIKTFHSFGYKIIAQSGHPIKLAPWAQEGSESSLHEFLKKTVETLKENDLKFYSNYSMLISLFLESNKNKQMDYYHKKFSIDTDTWNLKNIFKNNFSRLKTLKGENVRSLEELVIANWLFLHGVDYNYEIDYYKNANVKNNRPDLEYRPDFYLPKIDTYYEHFGLNADGSVAKWMSPKYINLVKFKRGLHSRSKTNLIETYSYMFFDGSIFSNLKKMLNERGLLTELITQPEVNDRFYQNAEDELLQIISTAIKHIRSQGKFSSEYKTNFSPNADMIDQMFNEVLVAILSAYEKYLNTYDLLDFDEMIMKASKLIESGKYINPYKFICIDEFQDISSSRLRLIKSLANQSPDMRVFAVGDDWQSIYKFAGADINIFTDLEKYLGVTKKLYLTQTFRCNQGIADVATKFILKNPNQVVKKVEARNKEQTKVFKTLIYSQDHEQFLLIEKELEKIYQFGEEKAEVLIIYRNNSEIKMFNTWVAKYKEKLTIRKMTIHKSKGTEADYVFIMNLNESTMPSEKSDHFLLRQYLSKPEKHPFAEERRIFYVALTRAKKKVFLVSKQGSNSSFLDEIIEDSAGTQLLEKN